MDERLGKVRRVSARRSWRRGGLHRQTWRLRRGQLGIDRPMRRVTHWPASLMLVRHGESIGNVARDVAEAAGHPSIDIAERDMDVGLSAQGREQAVALGRWLGALPRSARPTVA